MDIDGITKDKIRYQGDHSNEMNMRITEQNTNNLLTKDLENRQVDYRNLFDRYTSSRATLDDLNIQFSDETKRRQDAYDTNVSLTVQLKKTRDDLDINKQLLANMVESNARDANALNERINSLTAEKLDLTTDNTRLNVDLSATRNTADVLNSRIDTYHRIGYPYYNYPYYYNYPNYYSRYPYS